MHALDDRNFKPGLASQRYKSTALLLCQWLHGLKTNVTNLISPSLNEWDQSVSDILIFVYIQLDVLG